MAREYIRSHQSFYYIPIVQHAASFAFALIRAQPAFDRATVCSPAARIRSPRLGRYIYQRQYIASGDGHV